MRRGPASTPARSRRSSTTTGSCSSWWAFALAVAFGAWHALLPGHGKTLMAAYMVGSETKVRQAVAVGSAVAVMHTASVLGLGSAGASRWSRRSGRNRSTRGSGSCPVWSRSGLGAYLMIGRLAAWSDARREDSPRPRARRRGMTTTTTTITPHGHSHALPDGVSLTSRRGLLALALAGGILPSPSALIVMLGAINAHRVGYGIGLILAFSVGLALALIVVSLGALRARAADGDTACPRSGDGWCRCSRRRRSSAWACS